MMVTRTKPSRDIPHDHDAPTLAVRDLSLAYVPGTRNGRASTPRADGSAYALHNLNFTIAQGERLAIVGPNGAGKSTLLKLIAGTLHPTHGRVDVYGYGADEHICVAFVPQRSQVDWDFPVTVADVVMMGRVGQIGLFRRPGRRDRAIVAQSLARVNAEHLADRQIGALSGGQQQRVFIARALAQEAELLLLDEPLAGLDAPSQEALFVILDRLRDDGVTVLVATHDLNVAAERFDRIMLLNRGIVALGPPPVVLTPANLTAAYGGHIHVVAGEETLLLADTCCDHGEG